MRRLIFIGMCISLILLSGCNDTFKYTDDGIIDDYVECYNAFLIIEKQQSKDNINYTYIEDICKDYK